MNVFSKISCILGVSMALLGIIMLLIGKVDYEKAITIALCGLIMTKEDRKID